MERIADIAAVFAFVLMLVGIMSAGLSLAVVMLFPAAAVPMMVGGTLAGLIGAGVLRIVDSF